MAEGTVRQDEKVGRVAIYATAPNTHLETAEHERLVSLEKRSVDAEALARDAGLVAVADQDALALKAEKAVAWCKVRDLVPLSDEEYAVWGFWLPMTYSTANTDRYRFSDFNHAEGVPLNVRRLIIDAKDVFSSLEILAPYDKGAVQRLDPVLIGVIDWGRGKLERILLARWAESDANFVSFEDVRRIVGVRDGIRKNTPVRWFAQMVQSTKSDGDSVEIAFNMVIISICMAIPTLLIGIPVDALFGNGFWVTTICYALCLGVIWGTPVLRLFQRYRLKRQYPAVANNI